MLNEILAKLNQNEKLIGGGGIVVLVGWILGLILGSHTYGAVSYLGYTSPGVSVNYFSWGTAGLTASLAVLVAIVAVVVLYLKNAPNMNITWPLPVVQILLGLSVAAVVLAVLTVLFQLTNNLPDSTPLMVYIADLVLVAGGAAMAYGGYMEFTASKTAV